MAGASRMRRLGMAMETVEPCPERHRGGSSCSATGPEFNMSERETDDRPHQKQQQQCPRSEHHADRRGDVRIRREAVRATWSLCACHAWPARDAAHTTALGKKFAAVGYNPAAMQGFVTNFDTQRLLPRYSAIIDDLLKTFDKEFSEICDIRELFLKNYFGEMTPTSTFRPLWEIFQALGHFLNELMQMDRAVYFTTAIRLGMTVSVLQGILAEWRKDRPTEFDQSTGPPSQTGS